MQTFVKFMDPSAAQACKDKIHGRLYGGQIVQVSFLRDFTSAGWAPTILLLLGYNKGRAYGSDWLWLLGSLQVYYINDSAFAGA